MKKTILLLLILTSLLTTMSFAQNRQNPIEYRFKGGPLGLLEFISRNTLFPDQSRDNCSMGLSVSKISVTPLGKISDIQILNPIDPEIDKSVKQILKQTSFGWLKCDTINEIQNFYIQIAFVYFNIPYVFCDKDILPTYKMFVTPIVLTTSLSSKYSDKIPLDDESLMKKSTALIASGDYEKALSPVNELIKRYPYSKDLYQLRMLISKKLNDQSTLEQDLKKMSDFTDGLSLDDLF